MVIVLSQVYTQHSTRTQMESKQEMADKHVAETSTNTYLTQINLNVVFRMHICYHLLSANIYQMSLCVRKPTICMRENKDADQLRGNREADQRLCFRYTDSTFPPLLIPKFSRFWVSSVTVQAGLCWTWSETQIVGFLMHRLK